MNQTPQRYLAIDVFRGLTLALMMVVNMSVSDTQSYAPLLHAVWHGFTLTDAVFPSFLFVVGTAMSLTLTRYEAAGSAVFISKIAKRSALIFLCGYLLYWFPFFEFDKSGSLSMLPLANTRILGVLQRIGLCYGLAALIVHVGKERGALMFSAGALSLYWWALASFGDYTLAGNAPLKLDKWLLGDSHMYHGEGVPFDPEGLLGTLPSIVNVLAGYLAGRFVQRLGSSYETVAKLCLAGAACVLVGLAWSAVLPINKKLWTSSYVLLMVGIDLVVLAALTYVIDLRGRKGWTYFFEVLGKNTLFLYLLSEVLQSIGWLAHVDGKALFTWLYESFFTGWISDKNGSLLYAVVFLLGCWLVGYAMDRKKIYVKL